MCHRQHLGRGTLAASTTASATGPVVSPTLESDVRQFQHDGVQVADLLKQIDNSTAQVQAKLNAIKAKGDSISIADMFEMQMLMNRLSQLSEVSTSVISASNSVINQVARNVKG